MLVSVENYNIYMRYFSTDSGGAENEHCQEHKKELSVPKYRNANIGPYIVNIFSEIFNDLHQTIRKSAV